jgi:pyruvate-ferredoxin/flavodoxin oxidoreductase
MFVYDANGQATLGDLAAGSFRQMVEAAEGCPVAAIHPGTPWDAKEPGLEELGQRAAALA